MKNAKLFSLFASGFLALLLAGCFNPITVIPPKQNDANIDPFTVDILIGKDAGDARSIAGPDADRIKGNLRNIIQLVVVDGSGNIAAFDEVRRESDDDEEAVLRIDSIPFGQTYYFLLLMGHWERNYTAETQNGTGQYIYDAARAPTLLAAGLREQHVTGSGKVTVTMWPIVVDTVFTSGNLTAAPAAAAGKPGKVTLHPVEWGVTWTIQRGLTGNGLTDLVKAQKITGSAGETLESGSIQTMVREGAGDGVWSSAALSGTSGNLITRSLKAYTEGFGRIGAEGSVTFKLEYVPFNLTDAAAWSRVDDEKSAFNLEAGGPVWIIRNGVNDLAQDDKTDFTAFHNIGNTGMSAVNGNGAVRYEIAVKTPDEGSGLVIKDGVFVGPSTSSTPEITFTTGGYENEAEVYYAVVPKGTTPDYGDYTLLDMVEAGDQCEKITLESGQVGGDYDIYVIVYKDGEVSEPLVINTKEGGIEGDWIWGDAPYKSYYVASDGNDSNSGTKESPLATVGKALQNLAASYNMDWPNKGGTDEASGGIIILDTVDVAAQIDVDGDAEEYPPIILMDDPEQPGGKLQAQSSIGAANSLLWLRNGARVTLEGGLILAGTGDSSHKLRGVYVENSTFTMNGGVISDNSGIYGSGVFVSEGTFILNYGAISGNSTGDGGGVVLSNSTFTMNGGVISGNTADYGGGVFLYISTVTMTGGEIRGNTASTNGGGIYFYHGGSSISFNKIGGTINGCDNPDDPNPYSNMVKNASNVILSNSGHAVDGVGDYYSPIDKTLWPTDNLTYNYPTGGDFSGWD
jgi:hypothetical protein